jgi:hypothetical protein
MNIYIERCIWCCLECMRIKHLQYDVNYKDYNNDDLNYNNDLNYNLDINQYYKSTSQKPKNNQSLVSNIILNNTLQQPSSTTNDFIIDLSILKNEDDDGFELLDKNE